MQLIQYGTEFNKIHISPCVELLHDDNASVVRLFALCVAALMKFVSLHVGNCTSGIHIV